MALSENLKIPIFKTILNLTYFKSHPDLPVASELTISTVRGHWMVCLYVRVKWHSFCYHSLLLFICLQCSYQKSNQPPLRASWYIPRFPVSSDYSGLLKYAINWFCCLGRKVRTVDNCFPFTKYMKSFLLKMEIIVLYWAPDDINYHKKHVIYWVPIYLPLICGICHSSIKDLHRQN